MLHGLGKRPGAPLTQWAAIQQPVLICLGDDDQMVTREESEAVAAVLPNGRFQLLPNSKHPIEQVNLGALVDLTLADFVDNIINI
ncbi:MAG: alpha/beta hydrolase [Saprospiraceae bacterium]|nr:alpha/beta hydrolase [Saprospiraceae bacterium]